MSEERNTKKLRYGILGAVTIIVVLALFALPGTNDTENIDEETRELNELAIRLVQDFKGTDGNGSTIKSSLERKIGIFYRDEDIFNDLSTKLDWIAFQKPDETDSIFEVHFNFKTYREDSKYIFIVDVSNGEITSGNFAGKETLDFVNSISGIG